MELSTLKDAFERVAKKQRLSSSRNQELIEQITQEMEGALMKMQTTDADAGLFYQKPVLKELNAKLRGMTSSNLLEGLQELNIALSKCAKALEKNFNPGISKAYGSMSFDLHIVNQIIASHLYRLGLFNLGDCFVKESHETDAHEMKSQFLDMYRILEAMKSRDVGPALAWATLQSQCLLANGSTLELKLQQLQFFEKLQKCDKKVALSYARTYLAPFTSMHKVEIQKLMACLLWAGRLEQSPYAELMSDAHWENITSEVSQQFCSLLGQSHESPLSIVITAGILGLPTLLKLANVMAANKEWQTMKQLPVPMDLGREFQFHSVFVCPILKEQGSEENPPMLMPCGHVLSKQSITKLSKGSSRTFKCPYCPLEATVTQCKQLHF